MNKKILGIIAGSVAALGSAIIAAPAHAQQATLPVTVTIRDALFLRTYESLNFVVNENDLAGGSVIQEGVYDEAAGSSSLSTTPPTASGTRESSIVKRIPELYQIWGIAQGQTPEVLISASVPNLTNGTGDAITMSVPTGQPEGSIKTSGRARYFSAPVDLSFDFGENDAIPGSYSGGELTITVTDP